MTDDLISRQAAIKAIEDLQDCYNGFSDTYDKACIIGVLEEIPTAQVNTPTDTPTDTISRQAAIAEFSCCQLTPDGGIDANYAIDFLEQLPSAQRTGRWIFETLDGTPGYRPTVMFCSKCGRVSIADYSYCPNCGSRMEIKDHE